MIRIVEPPPETIVVTTFATLLPPVSSWIGLHSAHAVAAASAYMPARRRSWLSRGL